MEPEASRSAGAADGPRLTGPRVTGLRAALAVLTGGLTVLAFPRYGSEIGLDFLVWVALVPLFVAARGVGARRGFALGWFAGLTLECAGFIWILYAARSFSDLGRVPSSLIFLAWLLWEALPWGLLGAALGRLRRPESLVWIPFLWTGIEHVWPRVFPWHLGGALWSRPWIVQCVDLGGASLLTWLVAFAAMVVARGVECAAGRGRFPAVPAAALVVLIAFGLGYGAWRREDVGQRAADDPRLRVGLVQGFIDPRRLPEGEDELEIYLERSEELIRREGPLDLLVWPEGVNPHGVVRDGGGAPVWAFLHQHGRDDLRGRLLALDVPLVFGSAAYGAFDSEGVPRAQWNVAVYVHPGGRVETYAKNHRVPFGENVFLPRPWLRAVGLRHVGGIDAGDGNPRFELGPWRFRNLICYEVILPAYARRSARGADFLVNITEDIWYGRTAHIPQHLSVLVLRSIESRTPVVRCTNAGPSGVTTPVGTWKGTPRIFARDSLVVEAVPFRERTVYARGGWAFPWAALALGIAGLVLAGRRSGAEPRPPARLRV